MDTLLLDSLWKTARKWRAGENVEKVDSARGRIINMGEEAVEYIVLKYLPKDDRFSTRAIRDICLKVPDMCGSAVRKVLESGDTIALKNALYVASEVELRETEPALISLLKTKKDKRWRARVLRALYKSGSGKACPTVEGFVEHPYVYVRMRAILFLGEKRCKGAKRHLWRALNDDYFMVRDAGRRYLAEMGFSRLEFEGYVGKVRKIELLKLLSERCPDLNLLFLVKPENPFERYWYGRAKCR